MEILFWIIFIFLAIGYTFKIFLRYGLPWLLSRFVQNQQQKYSNSQASNNYNNPPSPDGQVNVKVNKKKKNDAEVDDFGEYVEYEDVD
jgi:hypothetical protein